MFDFNTAEEQRSGFSGSLIPEGTIAIVVASIRPGGSGDGGLIRNADSGSSGLDFEFTIQGGDYDRRKIWNLYTIDGHTEGQQTAAKISKSALRAMLEAARNIQPSDTSDNAMAARKVASYADFNGLTFPVEIGIDTGRLKNKAHGPDSEKWPDKNIIRSIITPDQEGYQNVGSTGAKPSASKPAQAPAQASAGKPTWAQ